MATWGPQDRIEKLVEIHTPWCVIAGMSTWKPYVEWTDEEFQAYAIKCCQPDWRVFKERLVSEEVEFEVELDKFIDEQIAKGDTTTAIADLANFLLKGSP